MPSAQPGSQLRLFLFALLILTICSNLPGAAADRYAVGKRADTTLAPSSTESPSSSVSLNDATTTTGAGEGAKGSSSVTEAMTTGEGNKTTSSTSLSSSATMAPTSAIGSNASNFTTAVFNATLTPNALPLTPMITPGFSVGGVLLILSGTAYSFIGMKNKMIHIFLSAGYLASLGVTVLIIYVMNPPVSLAVQGAYVVAISMTGLIIGGASLIFTEMTEGLGCLFGGFCLSMWLLVLSPGGLLKSTGAICGLIAAFTVGTYATSFSHYTRPYGLIGSISFGGATTVVMGIDCFSRAGLKEFWVYIWNLNENLFPLGATTYPLTKGIRVEIAAIIVIFLAGIVSQSRLWNIIKTQREKRAVQRLEDERHVEQEEANVGRRIEMENERARGEWEAVYGDKDSSKINSQDSGISMNSHSKAARSTITSTRHSKDEIEMAEMKVPDMTGAGLATKGADGVVTVQVVEDDVPIGEDGNPIERRKSQKSLRASTEQIWVIGADGEARPASAMSKRNSTREIRRKSTGPDVTPLPFTVPENGGEGEGEGEGEIQDDRSSVATFATDVLGKRCSALSRGLSKRSLNATRLSQIKNASEDKLVIPHEDDDRSSVAATMDGLSDDDERSLSGFSSSRSRAGHIVDKSIPEAQKSSPDSPDAESNPEKTSEVTRPEVAEMMLTPKSLTSSTDPKPAADSTEVLPTPSISDHPVASVKSTSVPAALTKSALPAAVSRVVMSYRTNEWAKHLSLAEAPEPEALNLKSYTPTPNSSINPNGNGVSKIVGEDTKDEIIPAHGSEEDKETAAPLNVDELQKTAQDGAVAPAPLRSVSTRGPPSAHMNNPRPYQMRNSSAHNIGALVESPVEGGFDQNAFSRSSTSLGGTNFARTSANTLMAKRDTILRSKSSTFIPMAPAREQVILSQTGQVPLPSRSASTASYNPYGPAYNSGTASPVPYAPSPSASQSQFQVHDLKLEDDNLSLSARRTLIRQVSNSAIGSRATSSFTSSTGGNFTTFDSHQPQRDRMSNIAPQTARDAQLASWRASVAQDLSTTSTAAPSPSNHVVVNALVEEKRRAEWMKAMEQRKKVEKEKLWDERMRSGDMVNAHREALRKMQREASKHV